MPKTRAPIVGMHFRPPAKAILQCLPQGTTLHLRREPDNQYDPNATKVLVRSADIPEGQYQELDTLVAGYGTTIQEILAQSEWFLGYIAAKSGEAGLIAPLLDKEPARIWVGALIFDGSGKPMVEIEL